MKEFRILSPTAILGYGYPLDSLQQGLALQPDLIAVDAGSTDPGPYYLGAGVSFTDREAVKRDLMHIITGSRKMRIPIVIGSAGGAGGIPHVEWNLQIIEEIACEQGYNLRVAVIHAELEKDVVLRMLQDGKIEPLPPVGLLTEEDIACSTRIVAQMGMEPFIQALKQDVDIVLAGRAYDPAVFAALAVAKGYNPGLALHLGKILECAAIACEPGSGSDCMIGYLGSDYFRVKPLNPQRRCTELSVAAHTLYEKSNPYLLPGPGGVLDLRKTRFRQESDASVCVTGSEFVPAASYTLKLEGAKRTGYRTISIAGVRDPVMIAHIDDIIMGVKARVADNIQKLPDAYSLDFKIYGKNGVMGALEQVAHPSHELGIIIEAVAPSQKSANTICSLARSTLLHYGYPGRYTTAGNLAFPYSPSDFKAGEVYAFSLYHLTHVDDPLYLFPIEVVTLGSRKQQHRQGEEG